jgi:hypothetical protein
VLTHSAAKKYVLCHFAFSLIETVHQSHFGIVLFGAFTDYDINCLVLSLALCNTAAFKVLTSINPQQTDWKHQLQFLARKSSHFANHRISQTTVFCIRSPFADNRISQTNTFANHR